MRINSINRRRDLLKASAAALISTSFDLNTLCEADQAQTRSVKPTLCLFSKPLQNRPLRELPPILADFDFDAVDLTCRAGGHVLPERVVDDLPKADELFRAAGIKIAMITTGITDAGQDHAEEVIKTAASLNIRYAKPGYYSYGDLRNIHATLANVKSRVRDVAALCRQYGVQAGFHNHSGMTVGAALWDVWHTIRDLPPEAMGSYFDGGHATVEGGDAGSRIGMNLLASRIVMMAVKDFHWQKHPKTGWTPQWCPLGDGMVRWEQLLGRMKEQQFTGPISLHIEYGAQGPAGSEAGRAILAAIRHDATVIRELLKKFELL